MSQCEECHKDLAHGHWPHCKIAQIATLTAQLAEAERERLQWQLEHDLVLDALAKMEIERDELRAEVARLTAEDDALEMICQKAMQAREAAERRLAELQEAVADGIAYDRIMTDENRANLAAALARSNAS